MGTNRLITEASGFQAMQDVLRALTTYNPTTKGVGSAQNSLIDPALATTGAIVINGAHVASVAASSSFFTLTDTQIPIGGGCNFVLTMDAAGSGFGHPTNVLTSAEVSTLGAIASMPIDDTYTEWPTIPTNECPVGIYTVIAGTVSHVSGSSSFSLVTSAGGSHLFTQLAHHIRVDQTV
jgi:hypothetical protein